jgi:hypothetical protein
LQTLDPLEVLGTSQTEISITNGVLMFLFEFQGRSVGSPWIDATASLKGDSLTVQYPESMHHADFEDAVYVLMP